MKRFVIVLITIVTLAYILMLFDKVNNIGKGLLTTAGIISAVGALACQQSLSRSLPVYKSLSPSLCALVIPSSWKMEQKPLKK